MPDPTLEAVHYTVQQTSQVANTAHDRLDEVVRFTKLHMVATTVIGAILSATVVFGMYELLAFQKQLDLADQKMAAAQQANADYQKQSKVLRDQMAQTQGEIDALSAAQAQKTQTIVVRDQQAQAALAEVVSQNKTVQQAIADMESHNAVAPGQAEVTADGNVEVTKPAAQNFTATAIERDQLKLDLGDTKSILADEQQKNQACTANVTALTQAVDSCQQVTAKYAAAAEAEHKAAVKSKKQKFLDGVKKAGWLLLGVGIGKVAAL